MKEISPKLSWPVLLVSITAKEGLAKPPSFKAFLSFSSVMLCTPARVFSSFNENFSPFSLVVSEELSIFAAEPSVWERAVSPSNEVAAVSVLLSLAEVSFLNAVNNQDFLSPSQVRRTPALWVSLSKFTRFLLLETTRISFRISCKLSRTSGWYFTSLERP